MRINQEKKRFSMAIKHLKNAVRSVVLGQRPHIGQPRCNAGVLGKVFLNDGELSAGCERQ